MTVINIKIKFKSLRNLILFTALVGTSISISSINVNAKPKRSKNTKVVKRISKSSRQTINLVLKSRDEKGLNNFVYQTVSPGSGNFRRFLTPKKFASRYGQSNQKINQFKRYLNRYHLTTSVEPGNIVLNVSGTTANFNQALKIKLISVKEDGQTSQKLNRQPRWPKYLRKTVLNEVGLTKENVSPNENLYSVKDNSLKKNKTDGTPNKFIDRYNMSPLYKNHNLGENQSIGIITFGGYQSKDAYKFWNTMDIPAKRNRLHNFYPLNDKGKIKDNSETTLDVQQAGSIAPEADLNVYITEPSVSGMVSSLSSAISSNKNSSLSISWGQSEHKISQLIKSGTIPNNYNSIINLLLMQAASQGISVFAASGDSGAYDGMNVSEEYPYLSVDTPANSPYLTAVGGTTLPSQYNVNGNTVTILRERAWASEYLYPKYRNDKAINSNTDKFISSYFLGSGGGFSDFNAKPAYQRGVSGVGDYQAQQLWVVKGGSIYSLVQPKNISGSRAGRNLPDLTANADPNTGYVSYYHGDFTQNGGTSVVAPQFAGASAVINSSLQSRVGFWNPQIYRLAQRNDSPFTKIDNNVDNTNLYYVGQPGKTYNQATGLGTVNFARLKRLFKVANY